MNPTSTSHPTPAIDALLSRVRQRLLREVWIFGLGRALFVSALWLLMMFLVDWTLHVPAGIRWVNLGIMLGLPAIVLWRELFQRLRRVPDATGLAVLVERAHPELHELLVSAVQLSAQGNQPGAADPGLIAKVIAEAEAAAANLSLEQLTDPRPPRRSLTLGTLATAATVLTLLLQSDAAAIFLARITGGPTNWPQRTHLTLEIPLAGEVHSTQATIELDVARGSDVPVIVRCEGVIPDDISVHFAGGHTALLGSAGHGVFRTLLRSVQEDMSFFITGGDDTDGQPSAIIHVLQPPDISGIAILVEPPAYSGLEQRIEYDRDAQVLAASKLTIFVRPDPADATGIARILPEDRSIELERADFPGPDGNGQQDSLSFQFVAEKSLRYRFELLDSTGLSNPDPGLYAIRVEADRPPIVDMLSPARGEVESVIGGALPFKALYSDDFGLSELAWRGLPTSGAAGSDRPFNPLSSAQPEGSTSLAASKGNRAQQFTTRSLEVSELFGDATPVIGEVFQLEVRATDNREPSAQETTSRSVRIRIVSTDEFLRHIQDRLARVRSKVEALSKLMEDKQADTLDLVASMETDDPEVLDSTSIQGALSAARRIEGDSKALSREVTSIASALLWSRIDERADLILSELQTRTQDVANRNFHPEPWLELYALHQAGRLGNADFADKLVKVAGIALKISEQQAPAAVAGLRRSMDITHLTAQYDILVKVTEEQAEARRQAETLLALLSEWDSYQSLLSAARDLLNGQNKLLDHTRQFYKEN